MFYLVHMVITPPADRAEQAAFDDAKVREKAYSQELQRAGAWPHLWRVVGQYANYSIFDVESNDTLHDMLAKLPLYPYMAITVTPLANHPSAV